ncbi:MAG: MarR family winged helix-turn-helix transcriptional regulator [Bacteroidota bacterium]
MKYELLQSLLPYLEEYEKTNPKTQDPQHFAVWLARQSGKQAPETSDKQVEAGESTEVLIGKLLFFLTRYARAYSRKALEGSLLGSMDEFVYLATLQAYGVMSKTDLIYRNRHEKPTGMDIIKRLLALELIQQRDDVADRRSKLLEITEKGLATLGGLYGRMGLVSHLITGNLSKTERVDLLQMLEKLENFHQVVLAKTKNEPFEGLMRVVVGM